MMGLVSLFMLGFEVRVRQQAKSRVRDPYHSILLSLVVGLLMRLKITLRYEKKIDAE